jgi:cellobiose-specific phosphotransferase system component IIA
MLNIKFEHLRVYIQAHHHHKYLIPQQNSGEYIPMYQLVYHQQAMPHNTKTPDAHPHPQAQ